MLCMASLGVAPLKIFQNLLDNHTNLFSSFSQASMAFFLGDGGSCAFFQASAFFIFHMTEGKAGSRTRISKHERF